MPPKKTPNQDAAPSAAGSEHPQDASDGIENYELPRTLVTRVAKSALPDNAKLSKESVLALSKGTTVFINYLAATAHEVASNKQHKSVSASDVLKALEMIEFGDLVDGLQVELHAFREGQKGKKLTVSTTATTASKGKGKEKEKEKAVPTINIPARRRASTENGDQELPSRPTSRMDVDMDAEEGEGENSEVEPYVPGHGEDEEAEEAEEEAEGETLDDRVVMDDEDERRDALGVVSREIEARERREREVKESGVLERNSGQPNTDHA